MPATVALINEVSISDDKILTIIRSLNPNKAHGWDELSVRVIKLSDAVLITPVKITFTNCLRQGLFPEIWKYANVVPVHKKNEKNAKETIIRSLFSHFLAKYSNHLCTTLFTYISLLMNY